LNYLIRNKAGELTNSTILTLGSIILVTIFVLLLKSFELSPRYLFLIVSIPILLLASFNIVVSSSLIIVSLFINFNFYYFSISEIFSVFLLVSFLITHKFKLSEINNRIITFLFIFLISVLPSYFNILNNIIAISLSAHLLFFFIVIAVFSLSIKYRKELKTYTMVFLSFALLNSFDVIFTAIFSGKRVFGFTGIMFVDYVGYGIIILFLILLNTNKTKYFYSILFLILSLALIFTQTRSIWIVVLTVLFSIFIHSLLRNNFYLVSIRKVIKYSFIVITVLVVLVFSLKGYNEDVFKRLEVKKIEQTDDPNRFFLQINSFVTRYFIWSTAWNAFTSNPIIGIGFYSFPFNSHEYSDIEPILYDTYVKNLTPHETFLAVLTESGLIGLAGFLSFLFYTLIYAYRSVKISSDGEERNYSLVIFWLSIYTLLSMIVTDAWLWGHGLMLWSILIGTSIANRRLITSQNQ